MEILELKHMLTEILKIPYRGLIENWLYKTKLKKKKNRSYIEIDSNKSENSEKM